jgi:hypothetical protein
MKLEKLFFKGKKPSRIGFYIIGGIFYEDLKMDIAGASVCLYGGHFYYVKLASGSFCEIA